MAEQSGADLVELRCVTDRAAAGRRITERMEAGGSSSDATPAVADRLAAEADPWPEAVVVDTTGSPRESLQVALDAIGPH